MTLPVLLLTLLSIVTTSSLQTAGSPAVVFVCEHGAAKSLIASAYFNKLAAERGLSVRSAFRAVSPQDDLSVRAVAGLKADGLAIPDQKPTAIAAGDIEHATHIFAIGCPLPTAAAQSGKASSWDDVPDDQGYPAMRDAILKHVKALLDHIQPGKG
jgi:protein-tyrosine-phosphatase